ncbi:MAG: hypothetical protein M3N45_09790, partial [Actinomycetota bacterium]|nr:hypothetical protein [Actinomycetota bacterium]
MDTGGTGVNLQCFELWGKLVPMTENNGGFAELVGTELSTAEEGRAAVSLEAAERHLNPSGTVHGG